MKFGERKSTMLEEVIFVLKDKIKRLKIVICVLSIMLILTLTIIAYLGFKLYVNGNPDGEIDSVCYKSVTYYHLMNYNSKSNRIRKDREKAKVEERI